jgi:hypothetical protein
VNGEKYIGLDVHQATISVAILDSTGKLVMESILGDQRRNHSPVFCRAPWSIVGDL